MSKAAELNDYIWIEAIKYNTAVNFTTHAYFKII